MQVKQKQPFITPKLVGGMRDYLPKQMDAKQKMVDTIKKVYTTFGFAPLDTPAIERLDVLTGNNPKFKMNLFKTLISSGANNTSTDKINTALRFDLTVPLSRVVAQYRGKLPKIFKRYQIGKVWRGERAQTGRFREFTQFDADIIGTNSILADIETVQIIYNVMQALKIKKFLIKINNRKILNALAQLIGITNQDQINSIIRIIDKKEKITKQQLKQDLLNALPKSAKKQTNTILKFINTRGMESQIIKFISKTPLGKQGADELKQLANALNVLKISNWEIDFSIARGLDYYTGTVFETFLTDMPEIGSVYSGGRFDNLSNRFIPKSNIPAVGASVGIDRLFTALEKLNKTQGKASPTQVLIAMFDKSMQTEYMKIAQQIRKYSIPTEIYLNEATLKSQIIYAAKQEIPFVVIIGENEKATNKAIIKNMKTKTQETVLRKNLIQRIRNLTNKLQ